MKIELSEVLEIIDNTAAAYPEDIFPVDLPDGSGKAARMARITCANIAAQIKLLAEELADEEEG